eukprot:scaffold2336_cov74-Phaeocystis_antarctica.AAC.4
MATLTMPNPHQARGRWPPQASLAARPPPPLGRSPPQPTGPARRRRRGRALPSPPGPWWGLESGSGWDLGASQQLVHGILEAQVVLCTGAAADAEDHLVACLATPRQAVVLLTRLRKRGHELDISTRTEAPLSGAADGDAADAALVRPLRLVEEVEQLLQHRRAQRVDRLRPVEQHVCETVSVVRDDDRLGCGGVAAHWPRQRPQRVCGGGDQQHERQAALPADGEHRVDAAL